MTEPLELLDRRRRLFCSQPELTISYCCQQRWHHLPFEKQEPTRISSTVLRTSVLFLLFRLGLMRQGQSRGYARHHRDRYFASIHCSTSCKSITTTMATLAAVPKNRVGMIPSSRPLKGVQVLSSCMMHPVTSFPQLSR